MITPDQIRNSAKFGSPLRAEVLLELADRLEKLEAMRCGAGNDAVLFGGGGTEMSDTPRKYMTDGMRVREAVAIALEKASSPLPAPVENWYYLDESLALHQLGKLAGFAEAYTEMEKVSKKRKIGYLCVMPEDTVTEWRAKLDRWLGDDGFSEKYRKREGDV